MTSTSTCNTDEPTINTDNLSFEDKYKLYQNQLREYNENISELQEQLENKELYEMKHKFLWELLEVPYAYKERTSESLRDEIDEEQELRDDLINCWNRLNASRVASCLQ